MTVKQKVASYFLPGYTVPFNPSVASQDCPHPITTAKATLLCPFRPDPAQETHTWKRVYLDRELLEETSFMSVLSCLSLRVTMTDALSILGVEGKAGKDQPFSLSPNRKLGAGMITPELLVHHFICSLYPLPPLQAPLSSLSPRNYSLLGGNLPFAQKIEFHTVGLAV